MQAKDSYIFERFSQRNSILESSRKFLNEKYRPEYHTSSRTLLNEIRFRIKLKVSE